MLYLHLGVLDRVFPGGEKAQEVGGVGSTGSISQRSVSSIKKSWVYLLSPISLFNKMSAIHGCMEFGMSAKHGRMLAARGESTTQAG